MSKVIPFQKLQLYCPCCLNGIKLDSHVRVRVKEINVCDYCAEICMWRKDGRLTKIDCKEAIRLMITGDWLGLQEIRHEIRQTQRYKNGNQK